MRILMLTQWFDPEPTFKGLAFARELVRRGHQVEVLTGFPNYPGGRLYDGYRIRLLQREEVDGIRILRVPLYPSHDGSALRRAANYLSFALSAVLIGTMLVRRADVMYVYHPPVTAGIAGAVIGMLRRIPYVYDIQDLWPDTLAATGMLNNRAALNLIARLCRAIYRRASKISVLSPGFRDRLVEQGVEADKIEVVYNWCDEDNFMQAGRDGQVSGMPGTAGEFSIVFAGTMGKAQALDAILDAAALVAEQCPAIRFVFVGAGIEAERLRDKARKERLENVTFLPRRPITEIGEVLRQADGLLVHLKDDPLFRITIPSKTQAYLAAGRPIIMGVRGNAAELVERAKAGITCMPECPESIAAAVVRLYTLPPRQREELGGNGQRFYQRELALAEGVGKFEQLFRRVAEGGTMPDRGTTKRILDIALSLAGIVLLFPLMVVIGCMVRMLHGSPAIFRQERPGLQGKPFNIRKFRTMTDKRDHRGELLPDGERLTRFGAFLRKSSLDELPELFNVLKGDMSLVGPRPLLMRYTPYFTEREKKRLTVLPGITGWAQINGRNETGWDRRLEYDVWYVENRSFLLDLKILALTFLRVFGGKGVVVDAKSIMLNLDEERSARKQG